MNMTPTVGNGPQPKDNDDDQSGYVGFANLPNQVHRKIAKRGFEFTIMVVGESGLGKTTLINNLFLTDLYVDRRIPTAQEKLRQPMKIEASTVEIEERGVKVRLTVVDAPGYGDGLNTTNDYKSVSKYIDQQFERYLKDESGLNRRNIADHRIHCLLYFISSFTRGLKPMDVECMKTLHRKVNIVPVIAKADALTTMELIQMKQTILQQIHEHQIRIYEIPDCDSDEDEDVQAKNAQLKKSIPFAIISSGELHDVQGKTVHARMYPWGSVEAENSDYSDFIKLRTMLTTHMQDLREITHEIHYENYRSDQLQSKTYIVNDERQKKLLQEKDNELRRMQDMLVKMQGHLVGQHK